MKFLYYSALVLSVSLAQACQNAAPKTPPTIEKATPAPTTPPVAAESAKAEAAWLVVNAKGGTTLFGKKIVLEKLPELLVDTLSKMTPVPNDIPVKYDGEVLMGMRGEVKTVVKETIDKAKIYKVLMSDKAEDMAKNFYVWYMDKLNTTDGFSLISQKSDAEAVMTGDLLKTETVPQSLPQSWA